MPGERNIVLRDDATMEMIEVDRGTGVHPVLLEEPSEAKEEPSTKEDDVEVNPDLALEQTKNSHLEPIYDMSCPNSEFINKDALLNRKVRRSKKAVPVYSSTPDGVRVTTA